jgi:hypothetical protein
MQRSHTQAARAIVGRGIHRGELPASTSVTLLLETLIGGAMMHALAVPAARRAELASTTGAHAARLVGFLGPRGRHPSGCRGGTRRGHPG